MIQVDFDKSEFELEAGLMVNVPPQRRKAKGQLTSLEATRAQLAEKRRLSEDKIRTDITFAFAAIKAAYERVRRTTDARDLADYMAEVEREKFNAGESDLLKVALREEKAAESASKAIDAQLEYQLGLAQLRTATGIDDGSVVEWSTVVTAKFEKLTSGRPKAGDALSTRRRIAVNQLRALPLDGESSFHP